ncbi:MAG: hypothetical protein IID36_06655 [Planctomycetes bacterium]|nr:hypothetical protein [Planctomycetota bacterium]
MNSRYTTVGLVWVMVLCVCGSVRAETLRFPADRPVDILHIKLDLTVNIPKKFTGGSAEIRFVPLREVSSIRFDAVDFDVTRVTLGVDGESARPVEYSNDGEVIEILLGDRPLGPADRATLRCAGCHAHACVGMFTECRDLSPRPGRTLRRRPYLIVP